MTGINGVSSVGINPTHMIAYNNNVLFAGLDSNDQYGLWITNGTAGGTYELTGITDANSQYGLFSTTNNRQIGRNPDFTAFNGNMLFEGYDSNYQFGYK